VKVTLRIFRFNLQSDKEPHYDSFTLEANPTDRLLDCLNKVRWEQDSSLAFRMSCAHGICGSDGMTINGISALACQKLVKEFDPNKEILIEPLSVFAVMKDLVVDLEPFFGEEKLVHPKNGITLTDAKATQEHIQAPDERAKIEDDIKCIMCACCVSACPVNQKEDPTYIGPAAVVRAHRYIFDPRVKETLERLSLMNQPHAAWSCKSYYKCTQVCPKEIQITKRILEVKRKILTDLKPKTSNKN
jgi:succinate dehydrogenase / fumarate reductase iron-sulfur subunit